MASNSLYLLLKSLQPLVSRLNSFFLPYCTDLEWSISTSLTLVQLLLWHHLPVCSWSCHLSHSVKPHHIFQIIKFLSLSVYNPPKEHFLFSSLPSDLAFTAGDDLTAQKFQVISSLAIVLRTWEALWAQRQWLERDLGGPVVGVSICFCHLEILNVFWTKSPALSLYIDSYNWCSWFCPWKWPLVDGLLLGGKKVWCHQEL